MRSGSPHEVPITDLVMEMTGSRTVPSDIETTWRALNDPEALKACIPGCESIERVSDHEYRVAMTARVGPVSARFAGRIVMSDIVAPTAYTLSFEGQGGAAGFAKGEARVALSAADPGTRIDYQAKAQVGGKLAQIGSRLVDGAAAKVADDFFARFVERLSAPPANAAIGVGVDDDAARDSVATPVAKEERHREVSILMWIQLAVAALIIAGMLYYWLARPA
jgi:uncharacterized protein